MSVVPKLEVVESEVSQVPPSVKFSFKKIALTSLLGLAAGLIFYFSYQWFIFEKTHITTDNAYIEGKIFPVNCRIMGYVKTVLAKESGLVKKGDILLQLDDVDLQIEKRFKELKLKKAASDFHRAKLLNKSKAISHADLEAVETVYMGAKADMDVTLLKLQFTQVNASSDGYIAKISVEPGQFVQPGQSLFTIVSLDELWVKANFKETQLSRIHKGQSAEIRVDAYPGEVWSGAVESIYPSSGARLSLLPPENATGNFTKIVQRIPVKISIKMPHSNRVLRSGMSVVPTIMVKDN